MMRDIAAVLPVLPVSLGQVWPEKRLKGGKQPLPTDAVVARVGKIDVTMGTLETLRDGRMLDDNVSAVVTVLCFHVAGH